MNILHIIAPVSFGGGESLLLSLLEQKRPNYNEMIALIYSSKLFEERLKNLKIPYINLRKKEIGQGRSKTFAFLDLFINIWLFIQLYLIVKKHSITLIHAHGFPASFLLYLVKVFDKKIASIYTHHGYRKMPKYYLEKYFFETIYNSFDAVTSVSKTALGSLRKAFNLTVKTQCIYNCISFKYLSELSTKKRKNEKLRFVQIGRFVKSKNHRLVIESFTKLDKKLQKNIEIIFIGDGPEFNSIQALVKEKHLNLHFSFLGMLPAEKIISILDSCDYALFPSSENEAFGIAAIECIARNLPILALNTPLMHEIINGYGLLKAPENFYQGFYEISQSIFSKDSFHMYASQYSPNIIKKQYTDLYDSILA